MRVLLLWLILASTAVAQAPPPTIILNAPVHEVAYGRTITVKIEPIVLTPPLVAVSYGWSVTELNPTSEDPIGSDLHIDRLDATEIIFGSGITPTVAEVVVTVALAKRVPPVPPQTSDTFKIEMLTKKARIKIGHSPPPGPQPVPTPQPVPPGPQPVPPGPQPVPPSPTPQPGSLARWFYDKASAAGYTAKDLTPLTTSMQSAVTQAEGTAFGDLAGPVNQKFYDAIAISADQKMVDTILQPMRGYFAIMYAQGKIKTLGDQVNSIKQIIDGLRALPTGATMLPLLPKSSRYARTGFFN